MSYYRYICMSDLISSTQFLSVWYELINAVVQLYRLIQKKKASTTLKITTIHQVSLGVALFCKISTQIRT